MTQSEYFSFFVDIRSSPQYEIFYINNCALTFLVVIGQTVSAMVMLTIGIFIVLFLRALQKKMKEAILENDRKRFLKAVEFHKYVIVLCGKLNESYALVIFSKYLVMAILICILGFQLVMVKYLGYCKFQNKILIGKFHCSWMVSL